MNISIFKSYDEFTLRRILLPQAWTRASSFILGTITHRGFPRKGFANWGKTGTAFGPYVQQLRAPIQTDLHRYPKLIATFSTSNSYLCRKFTSHHFFPKSMTRSNDGEPSSTARSKQRAGMLPKDDEYYIESSFVVFKARPYCDLHF